MKNRWIALLLALALLILCAAPALAVAPKVKDTDYEGGGVVEVEFASGRVQYRNLKVAVKDAAGNRLAARILEKDDDDLAFELILTADGLRKAKKAALERLAEKIPGSRLDEWKIVYPAVVVECRRDYNPDAIEDEGYDDRTKIFIRW